MKAKIYKNLPGDTLCKHAPPPLRGAVRLRRFEKEPGHFTLLVFPCQQQDRISSGAVAHVLSRLAPGAKLVAFGGCFTLEAIALLKEQDAEIFTQSDFPWFDANL